MLDFDFIDRFLENWDRFAQGENDLAPFIKENKDLFEEELANAFTEGDLRTASRLVFYMVVQVGGFIRCDSMLGWACASLVGSRDTTTNVEGVLSYFAGTVYLWWRDHRQDYAAYPLLDEWEQREFSKSLVIPMYESTTE